MTDASDSYSRRRSPATGDRWRLATDRILLQEAPTGRNTVQHFRSRTPCNIPGDKAVEGRELYIATEHKPLTFSLSTALTSTRHVKYATSTTSPNSQPISVTLQGTTIQSLMPFPAMPCVPSMQHNRQLSISRCWQRLRKPTQNSGPCKTPRPPLSSCDLCLFLLPQPPSPAT